MKETKLKKKEEENLLPFQCFFPGFCLFFNCFPFAFYFSMFHILISFITHIKTRKTLFNLILCCLRGGKKKKLWLTQEL